eukprot:TRINITY_DN4384_c0_g1_i2.p1 TRINITY_DN4384_c0_g1~~TRINITY_DN4384_c0_g1_i2.p1  ORF type:complete len:129 (-),score=11.07 TRINITY_DN4384_c0_g1_i2:74-460(-)
MDVNLQLWQACRDGNIEEVKKHLLAGGDLNFEQDQIGNRAESCYQVAIMHRQWPLVEYLLDQGIDLFRPNSKTHVINLYLLPVDKAELEQLLRDYERKTGSAHAKAQFEQFFKANEVVPSRRFANRTN